MEDHAHDLAQAKAAKLLKKRAPSVASGLSVGTDHNKKRGYAALRCSMNQNIKVHTSNQININVVVVYFKPVMNLNGSLVAPLLARLTAVGRSLKVTFNDTPDGSIGTVSYVGHSYEDDDRKAKCENTYRMEPTALFPVADITCILQDVLSGELENQQYDPVVCKEKTVELSDKIRAKVRDLSIPRYKIICLVHIGELNNQGLRISSRCLWNAKFDTFASHEFKNRSLFAVACVYGVYYE